MSKIELRNPLQRVIGTIGYAGAGKDAVPQLLGIPAAAFVDALKDVCLPVAQAFGLDLDKREDKDKFREVLVAVGRLGRSIDPDFWIKRLELPDAPTVAITGVRYLNECQAIQEVGGTLALVTRPGVKPANQEEDSSIAAIRTAWAMGELDMVEIENTGDLNTLKINAAAALNYPLHTRPPRVIHQDEVQVGRKLDIQEGDIYVSRRNPADDFEPSYTPPLPGEDTWGRIHDEPRATHNPSPQDFETGDQGPRFTFPNTWGSVTNLAAEGEEPFSSVAEEPLPYVARIEPTAFTVDPDRDWVEYMIETYPLFQVGVIDGEDAIPFLKSLGGDLDGVVIFRGKAPKGFDFDRGETVVLLPRRFGIDPVPQECSDPSCGCHGTNRLRPEPYLVVGVDPVCGLVVDVLVPPSWVQL